MSRDDKIHKEEIFPTTQRQESLEAFEGRYDETELATRFDVEDVKQRSLQIVLEVQSA